MSSAGWLIEASDQSMIVRLRAVRAPVDALEVAVHERVGKTRVGQRGQPGRQVVQQVDQHGSLVRGRASGGSSNVAVRRSGMR